MSGTAHAARRAAEQAARASYGRLVAFLAARDNDIAAAEDALSEALVTALSRWPEDGIPQNPEGWLMTVARNRRLNQYRAQKLRREAEPELALLQDGGDGVEPPEFPDRRLQLMFACCHPAIDAAARAPLILQVVLGFDAATIARSFLVDAKAMSQRLVRAKSRVRDAGIGFSLPSLADMPERLADVLDAIYAAFGQDWDAIGSAPAAESLTAEAIWLARLLVQLLPEEPEAKGLLALMLYCEARRPARRDADGGFVPLSRQDARLWDRPMIIEAEALLTQAARMGQFGRYQCEAAIQSVHIQRPITGRINHQGLLVLYDLLVAHTDSIAARISRAVVVADSGKPAQAAADLEAIDAAKVAGHQPWWVARAHVAALLDDRKKAGAALDTAIGLTADPAVRRHLEGLRAALTS